MKDDEPIRIPRDVPCYHNAGIPEPGNLNSGDVQA
jgi:hypothetical protein